MSFHLGTKNKFKLETPLKFKVPILVLKSHMVPDVCPNPHGCMEGYLRASLRIVALKNLLLDDSSVNEMSKCEEPF